MYQTLCISLLLNYIKLYYIYTIHAHIHTHHNSHKLLYNNNNNNNAHIKHIRTTNKHSLFTLRIRNIEIYSQIEKRDEMRFTREIQAFD